MAKPQPLLAWWAPSALAAALAVALAMQASVAAECHRDRSTHPRLARFQQAMAEGRFVTYEPTSIVVVDGHVTPASAEGIRADLAALRPHFDALVTYEAGHGLEALPAIAAELGFRALLVGVWKPGDARELQLALKAAHDHPALVLGIVLGNETVFRKELSMAQLAQALHAARALAPSLLFATSEPFHLYGNADAAAVLAESDLLLPNIHPVYQAWFKAGSTERQAAEFVRNVVGDLRQAYCGPVLVKETGEPTGPAGSGYAEAHQAAFWRALHEVLPASRDAATSTFSAFDLAWRAQDGGLASEAHWGVFDAQRRAKQAMQPLSP
jgi:exo-beta-1,3-glucanase (GH17 family)